MDKIELAARLSHEVNRNWCALNGDMSQPSWDDAPDWQRSSAFQGVEFHIANPYAENSASHDNWMAEKVKNGWVYGETKNPEANPPTHPCIIPFDQLPEVDQIKDALFRSTVHAVMGTEMKGSGVTVTDTSFNPSQDPMIKLIKTKANELADILGQLDPSRRRSIALTKLEDASMWGVKAAVCGDD